MKGFFGFTFLITLALLSFHIRETFGWKYVKQVYPKYLNYNYHEEPFHKRTVSYFKMKPSEKWLEEFKKTFIRKLNLKSIPHNNHINKTKVYESMPSKVKSYIKNLMDESKSKQRKRGIKISGFVHGEGYNARLGNSTVQLVFFKLANDILDTSIIEASIVMDSGELKCSHKNISMFEILPVYDYGNTKVLHDKSRLLAKYHIDHPMDHENRFVKIGSVPVDSNNSSFSLNFDVTKQWKSWVEQYSIAKESDKEFYKGVLISCVGCDCGNKIIDQDKIVLEYTYTDKYSEEELQSRTKRNVKFRAENREQFIKAHTPPILNECGDGASFQTCCVQRLVINVTDIGWNDWIIYPDYLAPNICSGSCKFKIRADTILPAFADSHRQNDEQNSEEYLNSVKSCCHPTNYETQYIYYLDEEARLRVAEYDNFSVTGCSCS